jgi:hypothetical protein
MSGSRAKAMRRHVYGSTKVKDVKDAQHYGLVKGGPGHVCAGLRSKLHAFKAMAKDKRGIHTHQPSSPVKIGKRHPGESKADFRARRAACNERKREREGSV